MIIAGDNSWYEKIFRVKETKAARVSVWGELLVTESFLEKNKKNRGLFFFLPFFSFLVDGTNRSYMGLGGELVG